MATYSNQFVLSFHAMPWPSVATSATWLTAAQDLAHTAYEPQRIQVSYRVSDFFEA